MADIFYYKEKNADALFSDPNIYIVPSYQRPYAWADKQIRELWEDLDEGRNNEVQLKSQGKDYHGYFLGPIFIVKTKKVPDYVEKKLDNALDSSWLDQDDRNIQFFDLLDGQQRLVTLYQAIN